MMNPFVLQIIIIAMIPVILALVMLLISNLSQIKNIREQVHFIAKNKTNKTVSFYGKSRSMKSLSKDINVIIDTYRTRELEIMKQDAEIKDTLTSMSHDIRTPLTSLKGYFELMEETDDPEERERYQNIIKERIDSLGEILENLFLYTKVSNSAYEMDLDKINISQLVVQTLFSYFDDFEKSGLSPQIDVDEDLTAVANEQSLKRIVQNLIKNCLVHGEGEVNISLKPLTVDDANWVKLSISNGLPEGSHPEADKVFDRFYKGDTSRHVNSSGIGLSVAKKMTLMMNGTINATVNNGLFTIDLMLPGVGNA